MKLKHYSIRKFFDLNILLYIFDYTAYKINLITHSFCFINLSMSIKLFTLRYWLRYANPYWQIGQFLFLVRLSNKLKN